jgi:hypothetical protein
VLMLICCKMVSSFITSLVSIRFSVVVSDISRTVSCCNWPPWVLFCIESVSIPVAVFRVLVELCADLMLTWFPLICVFYYLIALI